MSIVWSSEARRSLRAIRRFIAQDSEFYAARLITRIIERVERAALSPTQGHAVHEYPERPLKEVHEFPYRIIYGFSEDAFRVVTVVHFKQQLDKKRLPGPRGHPKRAGQGEGAFIPPSRRRRSGWRGDGAIGTELRVEG